MKGVACLCKYGERWQMELLRSWATRPDQSIGSILLLQSLSISFYNFISVKAKFNQ
jgi:hypothetical protein